MASLTKLKCGSYVVQFYQGENRRTIRLGKMSARMAEKTRLHIESLIQAKKVNIAPDDSTAIWLSTINKEFLKKLAAVELAVERKEITLVKFVDDWVEQLNVAETTKTLFRRTKALLVEHFGDINLRDIDNDQARQWSDSVRAKFPAEATWARHLKRTKQIFKAAASQKYCDENPFTGIVAPEQRNSKRSYFVSAQLVKELIADSSKKFGEVLALSRFGGLRIPSEITPQALDWSRFDWERKRFTVISPKTGPRDIPIFPELIEHLTPKSSGPVVNVTAKKNMRSRLLRLLERKGIKPWPRLFHNMRASRQTELSEAHGIYVASQWIGNSPAIASKHYLQVRDSDYEKAALRNALRSGAMSSVSECYQGHQELHIFTGESENRTSDMTPTGRVKTVNPSQFCKDRGGCAAICAAGLGFVIRRWEMLTVRERWAIKGMMRRAG